jgi:biotin carboxylase
MMSGTIVINNPFWWSADEKFTGASIATYLGVAHPRTVALPSHSYIEGVVHEESLRNLLPQIPWEEHVAYVGGFPVILKPSSGGGFKNVYKLHTIEQLWEAYNQTGTECMMLQEFISWDKYVRCLCIGQDNIMPIKFDVNEPYPHRYFDEPGYLTPEEHRLVVEWAQKLCRALGYDMNTCEFAIKDGVPYAIDFMNPAPDADVHSVGQNNFEWVVDAVARMAVEHALEPACARTPYHWSKFLEPEQATARGSGSVEL